MSPTPRDNLTSRFTWLLGVAAVGTLATTLVGVFGLDVTLADLTREGPIRFGFYIVLVVAGLCALAVTRRLSARWRQRGAIAANVLVFVGLAVFVFLVADVGSTNAAPPKFAWEPGDEPGTHNVTISVDTLTSGERLLVSAGWDEAGVLGTEQPPPNDVADTVVGTKKGVAETTFLVGPVERDRPLLIVARVIKRTGSPARLLCENVDRACSYERKTVRATPTSGTAASGSG